MRYYILVACMMMHLLATAQAPLKAPQEFQGHSQSYTLDGRLQLTALNPGSTQGLPSLDMAYPFDPAITSPLQAEARHDGSELFMLRLPTEDPLPGWDGSPQALVQDFMARAAHDISIPGRLVIQSHQTDDSGVEHIKVQQQYRGINILGAEASLHGTGGRLTYFLGRLQTDINLSVEPALTVKDIETLIHKNYVTVDVDPVNSLLQHILPEESAFSLIIYPTDSGARLAYHGYHHVDLMTRKEIIIDAQTGEILIDRPAFCALHALDLPDTPHDCTGASEDPQTGSGIDLFGRSQNLRTWLEGSTYYLLDGSRAMYNAARSVMPNDPVGTIWTIDGNGGSPQSRNFNVTQIVSNNNSWSDRTSVSGHLNAGEAYEYFLNTHSRNSINGQGGNIISIVDVREPNGNSMGNAFWNGQAIFYGDGDAAFLPLARGLDVAGHEMSHGVIQNTANLEYYGESGALNESFADIFGAMIDREDWLIGEDVVRTTAFPSGALRDMSDPANGGGGIDDLRRGWQPTKYSERFRGSEDNNGVHINSGIVNHAFYRFATASGVGRAAAEQVYYEVLENYLTRSSQFRDLRAAVEEVAMNRIGAAGRDAARAAFDFVEIPGGGGTEVDTEIDLNPGEDYLWLTTRNNQDLYFFSQPDGVQLLYNVTVQSRPSVTDNGAVTVFVDGDHNMRFLTGYPSSPQIGYIEQSPNPIWRNVIISRDGNFLAALTDSLNNAMYVFNLDCSNNGERCFNRFELYNPTYTEGIETGEVLYADAIEWDHSGQRIIYDALSRIESQSSADIDYWDIGEIDVWNPSTDRFTEGRIEKLFSQLPENTSIGNPTFSKNNRSIIAFDIIQDNNYGIIGMNIETGDNNLITDNNTVGYPNYSRLDDVLVYDRLGLLSSNDGISFIPLEADKISSAGSTSSLFPGGRWAVWFSDGQRIISDNEDVPVQNESVRVYPIPATDYVELISESSPIRQLRLLDIQGRMLDQDLDLDRHQIELDLSGYTAGTYILWIITDAGTQLTKIHKIAE